MRTRFRTNRLLMLATALLLVRPLPADEGMWTFDNPPLALLQQRYGFTPTQAWLDHLRLACVRLNSGGSAAFVSPHGLLLTNQHVVRDALQKASTPAHDLVANGMLAADAAGEVKAPGLEASVLQSMENVTARVQAAEAAAPAARQAAVRQAELAAIARESEAATGLHSETVSLYHGGEYWVYRYKTYSDLRVVFAPEQQAADFGGDTDNFTYPRYKLDMALVRVYENGKPLEGNESLRWNAQGAAENELVFTAGHPGSTEREDTLAQLTYQRDVYDPQYLLVVRQRIGALEAFAAAHPDHAREIQARLLGLQNVRKAREGEAAGLQSAALLAAKAAAEADLRQQVRARAEWQTAWGGAWTAIEAAEQAAGTRSHEIFFRGLDSDLYNAANSIVQYTAESAKPDAERAAGYHETQLPSLRRQLLAVAPIDPDLEIARMTAALQLDLDQDGAGDAWVRLALQGQTPAATARAAVSGTRLAEAAVRQQLLDGGSAAVEASTDPMIVLARRLDPMRREMQAWTQSQVQGPSDRASEQIAQARFAVYGKTTYPDATFTLRLSFGQVRGYPVAGTQAPYKTNFYGLLGRAAAFDFQPPFQLPSRYRDAPLPFDAATPLDFVTTNDIFGGNSGSPVVNRRGEIVGLIFDGNIESLAGNFAYDGAVNRAIAVHTAAMTAALGKLYGAQRLLDEITARP